jgi:tetratricopeptide (TPR) repeat protein
VEPPAYIPPGQRQENKVEAGESLASVIDAAETAKKTNDLFVAISLFRRAIDMQTKGKPAAKPDLFLAQRLALMTYKGGEKPDAEGNIDPKMAIAAFHQAEDILLKYCAPKISTDPETLGLCGAINKRLFELNNDLEYLDRAIRFYERGFYVKQDYYNGINVAYMYTQRANLLTDRFDAIVSYGHANMIRQCVVRICNELIDDEAAFGQRGDKQWVYMTLAESYQGLGLTSDEQRLASRIEAVATAFGKQSYLQQKAKLAQGMFEFMRRVRPDELNVKPVVGDGDQADSAVATQPLTTTQQFRPGVSPGAHPIVIDANIEPGKSIKSIEVNCKIEYSDYDSATDNKLKGSS